MDNPTDSLPYLPPEMYEEIFSNVSGEDFLSVINANPDWDDLLWNRKNTALFPPRYLNPKICSLPSRHSNWKSAVDSTMARDPHKYFGRKYELYDGSEEFVNHMLRLQSGNPFLGKYLGLNLDDLQIPTVLERFGSHLETLTLASWIWSSHYSRRRFPTTKQLPSLNPNVRDLTLDIQMKYTEVPQIQPLRELPPLSQLSKLDISSCVCFHSIWSADYAPILETVIVEAYGATLSELTCTPNLFLIEGVQDLFPNLRKLEVSNYFGSLSNQQIGVLAGFHSTMLESLDVELTDEVNFSPEIVNVLANFPALKSLARIPMPRINDELGTISGIQKLTMLSNRCL
ncbi:hypothetical protein Ocin01_19451 [Orchesella cincta]|uniref:F-box domain-containing protein n=1 Tax=Orchesella cincta TaxID=48709 RepID=A0A1D2M2U2_ORCCI|nr:hypothetical protein Ocin01_19451 [Orchesella cincta]